MTKGFEFIQLELEGAFLITPFVSYDRRGYFLKDYSKGVFEEHGISLELEEVFYTSSRKGVIRAIHFQRFKEQSKLVRCVSGRVFDVIVDLRKESNTFSEWRGYILSEKNKCQVFVPEGFGHGYLVLEPSIVTYKCGEKFYSEYDDGIIWNDPDIGIEWPLHLVEDIVLSDRDKDLRTFKEFSRDI